MLARAFLRKGRPAFNFWRSHARIHALGPFLYARMTHSKIVRWRAEVAFRMRTHAICKLFPFRRLRRALRKARQVGVYLRGVVHSSKRRAFNTCANRYTITQCMYESCFCLCVQCILPSPQMGRRVPRDGAPRGCSDGDHSQLARR